jgi:hypothetical protein
MDTVLGRQVFLMHSCLRGFCHDVDNIGFGEFRPATSLSASSAAAPLGNHVGDVVVVGAEKEVIWSNACRIVARVQHVEAILDRSVVDEPRGSMGAYSVVGAVPDAPVTICVLVPCPHPAPIALLDVQPESLHKRSV